MSRKLHGRPKNTLQSSRSKNLIKHHQVNLHKSPQVTTINFTNKPGMPNFTSWFFLAKTLVPVARWLLPGKWLTTSLLCNSDGTTEKMDSEGPHRLKLPPRHRDQHDTCLFARGPRKWCFFWTLTWRMSANLIGKSNYPNEWAPHFFLAIFFW